MLGLEMVIIPLLMLEFQMQSALKTDKMFFFLDIKNAYDSIPFCFLIENLNERNISTGIEN